MLRIPASLELPIFLIVPLNKLQREQREIAYSLSNGLCAICGKPYTGKQPQYAHKIANTEPNRKKYGSFIIDHPMNGAIVCSLKCNQAMNIAFNKGAVLGLLADIVMFEIRKFNNLGENNG